MPITNSAEIIVVGGGLYGSSTVYNLASQGAKNVMLLERGGPVPGGTAKSCAIVRTHYSIEANLVHSVESLKIFSEFDQRVGGDVGWQRTGYLILGPSEHAQPMRAVFARQNVYGIDTAELSPQEAREMHPLLWLDDVGVVGYDSFTGYANPRATKAAYTRRASDLGVTVRNDAPVIGIEQQGKSWKVFSQGEEFAAPTVILAAGPWTNQITASVGLELPYVISRHKVLTLQNDKEYDPRWPIVKDLTTPDKIYFRPETPDAMLIGTGDHGEPTTDPDDMPDSVDQQHTRRMRQLLAKRMPSFARAEQVRSLTGPYDITSDWNPIVGAVPGYDGLFVAVGFSGHGFKLAPTISEALAQTVLGLPVRVPIDMYRLQRFEEHAPLSGAYGIGSIS